MNRDEIEAITASGTTEISPVERATGPENIPGNCQIVRKGKLS